MPFCIQVVGVIISESVNDEYLDSPSYFKVGKRIFHFTSDFSLKLGFSSKVANWDSKSFCTYDYHLCFLILHLGFYFGSLPPYDGASTYAKICLDLSEFSAHVLPVFHFFLTTSGEFIKLEWSFSRWIDLSLFFSCEKICLPETYFKF